MITNIYFYTFNMSISCPGWIYYTAQWFSTQKSITGGYVCQSSCLLNIGLSNTYMRCMWFAIWFRLIYNKLLDLSINILWYSKRVQMVVQTAYINGVSIFMFLIDREWIHVYHNIWNIKKRRWNRGGAALAMDFD